MKTWILSLALVCFVLPGCVTHLAPNPMSKQRYETLPWVGPFEDAVELGVEQDRPILLILAAGERSGFC